MPKIKLDFSKVKNTQRFNTTHMPEGLYKAKITGVEDKPAKDGTPMLVYTFNILTPGYTDRVFPFYCKLQENQMWKIRDLLVAAGMDVPTKVVQVDPEDIKEKTIAVEVVDSFYEGQKRSSCGSVYPVSVLPEDDPTSGGLTPSQEKEDSTDDDDIMTYLNNLTGDISFDTQEKLG